VTRLELDAHKRLIGRASTGRPGPTVVVTGGVHGNEPAGLAALRRVLGRVEAERLPLRGELWAVAGNLRALAENRRYIVRDLNRGWFPETLASLVDAGPGEAAEDHEQLELLGLLAPLLVRGGPPIVFMDLHTTSGPAAPFSCMPDVLRNRAIALALPIPLVLGLEEVLEGSLLGYLCDLGHIGVAVESGQHVDPMAAEHHESCVWLALVAAGALAAEALPDLAERRARLAELTGGLPAVCEIRHRHGVRAQDEPFAMEPGWENFQPVRRGQLVARDRNGPVLAPRTGLMMLPRYQGLGDDGFFVASAVSPLGLRASAMARRLRLERMIAWLPGVQRHPERGDRYVVRPGDAAGGLFNWLGYRHVRVHGERQVYSRRHEGRVPPAPPEVRALAGRVKPAEP
jgi:hypothetical protein